MPTVLITGAASGIGRAAAQRFAAAGWRCVLVDRDVPGLQRVQQTLATPAELCCVDLTEPEQVQALSGLDGPIDAVVNNAGMSDSSGTPLADQDAGQQARLAALNLAAPAAVVSAVDRLLAPGARIVNVASGAGLRAIPFRGWYSATKAGLIAQTRALAAARPDLVVTALCPGFVRTELVDELIATGRLDPRQAVRKTPLGRMAEPAEMAETIAFLASPAASAIRGQVLSVCGGSSVFGGSRAFEPASEPVLPLDTPLSLSVTGDERGTWSLLATTGGARQTPAHQGAADTAMGSGATAGVAIATAATRSYPGLVDASTLALLRHDPQGRQAAAPFVAAVHEAGRRFASGYGRDASLTLLLPDTGAGAADWRLAGDAAAARMLVATLACELASRALRVNALVVGEGASPAALAPLVQYVAGAGSQFLTGQTLATTAG